MTGGMLLLVYGLVRAPLVGWGSIRDRLHLDRSAVLLTAFVFNELRSRNPFVPLAIVRVKGLVAADLTQLIAFSVSFPVFLRHPVHAGGPPLLAPRGGSSPISRSPPDSPWREA